MRLIYTPDKITTLQNYEVLVFGSSLEGHHTSGLSLLAREKFGAIMGKGVGIQGQSYAIPTTHVTLPVIGNYIADFTEYAKLHSSFKFWVTRIGCGHAGFTPAQIAPFFSDAMSLDNVILPEDFCKVIMESCKPKLPRYLCTKVHGQTKTLVDLLIEMNKTAHFTNPDDALTALFEYTSSLRNDGDEVAFNCSLRSINTFAREAFGREGLNVDKLEKSLHTSFYQGINKIYENYVVEKTMVLIEYLNDFRRYDSISQLMNDLREIGFYVNHCGAQSEAYYFGFGSPYSTGGYIAYFLQKYLELYWHDVTVNGQLNNKLFFEKFCGKYDKELKRLGIEELINKYYKQDSACHPEVMVPIDGFVGPIYVKKALSYSPDSNSHQRVYRKSCGEGKGPYYRQDLIEFQMVVKLLEKDDKYCFIPDEHDIESGYFIPIQDMSLPVFWSPWGGRLEFESEESKRNFIEMLISDKK